MNQTAKPSNNTNGREKEDLIPNKEVNDFLDELADAIQAKREAMDSLLKTSNLTEKQAMMEMEGLLKETKALAAKHEGVLQEKKLEKIKQESNAIDQIANELYGDNYKIFTGPFTANEPWVIYCSLFTLGDFNKQTTLRFEQGMSEKEIRERFEQSEFLSSVN